MTTQAEPGGRTGLGWHIQDPPTARAEGFPEKDAIGKQGVHKRRYLVRNPLGSLFLGKTILGAYEVTMRDLANKHRSFVTVVCDDQVSYQRMRRPKDEILVLIGSDVTALKDHGVVRVPTTEHRH